MKRLKLALMIFGVIYLHYIPEVCLIDALISGVAFHQDPYKL